MTTNSDVSKFTKFLILACSHEDKKLDKGEKDWIASNAPSLVAYAKRTGATAAHLKAINGVAKSLTATTKAADPDALNEHLYELGSWVRSKKKALEKDTSISLPQLKLLQSVAMVSRTNSERAWARVVKGVGMLKDADLANRITPKAEGPEKILTELRASVRKLTGKTGTEISPALKDKLRTGKTRPMYREYVKLRRMYTKQGANYLRAHVRKSGDAKGLVDAQATVKHLRDKGFVHSMPKGFEGKVDENGHIYTKHGEKINGNVVGRVVMNPNYTKGSSTAVLTYVPTEDSGKPQYLYTKDAKAQAIANKQAKVSNIIDNIDSIRKNWSQDFGEPAPTNILATLLETAHQTSARIGNLGNKTGDEATFGLTTLRAKDVKTGDGTVKFSYLGKAAQRQNHVLRPVDVASKKAIKIIEKLKENSKANDYLFRYKSKRITSRMVNDYFKDCGSPGTVHYLRSVKGAVMLKEALATAPKKGMDQKKATLFLVKALTKVGKQLGHFRDGVVTPQTALQSYVPPAMVEKYYQDYGIRPPTKVQRVLELARKDQGLPPASNEGTSSKKAVEKEVAPTKQVINPKAVKAQEQEVKKAAASGDKEHHNFHLRKLRAIKRGTYAPALMEVPMQLKQIPSWFRRKSGRDQRDYLKAHPGSKLKPTKLISEE